VVDAAEVHVTAYGFIILKLSPSWTMRFSEFTHSDVPSGVTDRGQGGEPPPLAS